MWFLRNQPNPLKAKEIVKSFKPGIDELRKHIDAIISDEMKAMRDRHYAKYTELDVPATLAKEMANLHVLASACDIVHVAKDCVLPIKTVGEIYFTLGDRLQLNWLRDKAHGLLSHAYWDNLAIHTLNESLFDDQMLLTADVTKTSCKDDVCEGALSSWYQENEKELQRYDTFIEDLKYQETINKSMITVAMHRLEALLAARLAKSAA